MLALVAIGADAASAQSVVVTTTTVSVTTDTATVEVQAYDDPDLDGTDADATPEPEAPEVVAPTVETPKAEPPKAEKVKPPKPEKPKPEKSQPAPPEPTPESTVPTRPQPAVDLAPPQSAPAHARPDDRERADDSGPRARPGARKAKLRVEAAKPAAPRLESAPSLERSGVRPLTGTRERAGEGSRQAARPVPAATPERSHAVSARNGSDPARPTPKPSGSAVVTSSRAPRLTSDGVAPAAAVWLDRPRARVLIFGGPGGYHVWPLLLAILFAAGAGYVGGRHARRGPPLTAWRAALRRRSAGPRPTARRLASLDRRLRRLPVRLLRRVTSPWPTTRMLVTGSARGSCSRQD